MKILSISIAAYNVEEYLSNCLNSFIDEGNPLMDQVEVLIVNDGSNDSTATIGKEYEQRYPNTFRLIDKKNGGYGSTINASLAVATGKYYKLVDGDDWVDTEAFYKLVAFLSDCDSDMVISKYCFVSDVDGSKRIASRSIPFDGITKDFNQLKGEDAFEMHYLSFKTDILKEHHIRITEKCFYTDVEYMLKPIPFIETFAALDECVYMYRIGREGQSVSISSWQKNIDMALKVTFELLAFYNKLSSEELSEIKRAYIFNRIEGTAEGKYKIFLSFVPNKKTKTKLINYDKDLKAANVDIYEACMRNKFVKILRTSGFSLYHPMSKVYRIHLKHTNQL